MEGEKGTVCVTGAGGYIASWLVKLLLSNGYKVHGTVRDPCDEENSHLKKFDKAAENLKLFKADLLDYDSLLPAISGCDGVFHTASPVPSSKVANPEVELYAPAVTGTQNVLKACSEFKVRRVVVVSSTASVVMNPDWPVDKKMDESCWSDKEYCKTTENFYCLSKTMAEEEAFKYSNETGLDVVTVLPCYVTGPMLQPTVNATSLAFINMIKGVCETMEDTNRNLVDVRDVADALLITYEKPEAKGRYICSCCSLKTSDFIAKFKSFFPNYKYPKSFSDPTTTTPGGVVTSEKLKGLGWKCRDMDESMIDSVKSYEEAGLMNES